MGNNPTDERPKRMDFWLTAKANDVLENYEGNKADFVNRAIVAYAHSLNGDSVPQLIFNGIDDLVQIYVLPTNHPGDQRWIRPLKVAAQRNGLLQPYAFLYTPLINSEQPILIPKTMETIWAPFLAGHGCRVDSKVVVTPGTYIDIDDKLHSLIELENPRSLEITKRSIVWVQEK